MTTMSQPMQVLTSSQTAEWYTPPYIIEAAREVMGWISLDPASCTTANKWIGAEIFFTEVDDGLSREWFGHVWLNPPYGIVGGRSSQDTWARKLEEEYASDRVTEAILLTKTAPGYKWWERLFRRWPICLCEERPRFLKLDKYGQITEQGQCKAGRSFWYFGPYEDKFSEVFSKLGRVILQEDQ